MKLKHRLLNQNIIIFFSALALTTCLCLIFGYFYGEFKSIPVLNSSSKTEIIAVSGKDEILFSKAFSSLEVKEILMNISFNKLYFIRDNVKYDIKIDEFPNQSGEINKIVKLTPEIKIGGFYKVMILFTVSAFILVFSAANIIAQNYNKKYIIEPIINLKRETEKLACGDLDGGIVDDGVGEIDELAKSIEILRIKLKESVYYKEKYDENRNFLISSISHDLKTPVTSVKGYIEGVLDGVANTKEKQTEYLKKAVDKTDLISNMIDDLLLYSKLDLNQIPFDLQKTDIVEYIKDSVEDSFIDFEKEGKKVVLETDVEGILTLIDINRFRRVVQNILDNAKTHIEKNTGKIVIKIRENKSSVIIEFQDNGKGIKKEDLQYIFDRFYRGDTTRKNSGSSGLGLAIAKLIVEALGGRIWAISDENKGTSILISLKKVE